MLQNVLCYRTLYVTERFMLQNVLCYRTFYVTERFMLQNILFPKSCSLCHNVEKKHGTAGEAKDENMAHAHFTLGNLGYKHTLRICNTSCFTTATMFTRTRLNVTFKHTLSPLMRNGSFPGHIIYVDAKGQ